MSDTSNRLLKLNDNDIERLRRLWDAGIASGSAGEVEFPALRAEARNRIQQIDERATSARPTSS